MNFSSRPDRTIIFQALSNLLQNIYITKGDKGLVLEQYIYKDKFLILSDLHKGAKNGVNDLFWDQDPFACGSGNIKRICRRDF